MEKLLPNPANIRTNTKGFTLIELMIVITIIAVLSTIGLILYGTVQKSARIAKRIGDLTSIKTALALYYSRNGSYPIATTWRSECPSWVGVASNLVIPGLVPDYMVAFPQDPQMDKAANTSCYLYMTSNSNGTDYKLLDYNIIEFTAADVDSNPNFVDPARPSSGVKAWAVYSSSVSRNW